MKIAIVGTAPSSVADAPYDDKSWQIWSLGNNASKITRFNRWFELHTLEVLVAASAMNQQRAEFLKKIGKDLVIGHPDPSFPDAYAYPKDEIVSKFGGYFTSSIAWMIALAINDGAEEIGLWGVDMIGDCEYSQQRACCEYLLGVAVGKGIKVTISPHSPLLRAERLYAFEHTSLAAEIQHRIRETTDMHAKKDADYIKAIREKAFAEGQLIALRDMERRWG